MSDLTIIKEVVDFTWDRQYEDDSILEKLRVYNHYNCTNWKILLPTKGVLLVQIAPRLEVFTDSDVLFMGQTTINFHVLDNNLGFAAILYELFTKAHLDFLSSFDSREKTSALSKFLPIFPEVEAQHEIDLLLRIGV